MPKRTCYSNQKNVHLVFCTYVPNGYPPTHTQPSSYSDVCCVCCYTPLREIMELCWRTIPRIQEQLTRSYALIIQQVAADSTLYVSISNVSLTSLPLPPYSKLWQKCFPITVLPSTSTMLPPSPFSSSSPSTCHNATMLDSSGWQIVQHLKVLITAAIDKQIICPTSLRMEIVSYPSSSAAPGIRLQLPPSFTKCSMGLEPLSIHLCSYYLPPGSYIPKPLTTTTTGVILKVFLGLGPVPVPPQKPTQPLDYTR